MNEADHREQRELLIYAIAAEHQAIRAQVVFQMGRANQLATVAIGGAAAILTALVGLRLDSPLQLSATSLVSAGLAFITLAYVGVVGEELQAADYLRDQGDLVRRLLVDVIPETYEGRNGARTAPVLAWEELAATRTRAPRWVTFTSSLAALELGATVVLALAVLAWSVWAWVSDSALRSTVNNALIAIDALLTAAAVMSVFFVLLVQDRRAQPKAAAGEA
jgi:hypothetical protein